MKEIRLNKGNWLEASKNLDFHKQDKYLLNWFQILHIKQRSRCNTTTLFPEFTRNVGCVLSNRFAGNRSPQFASFYLTYAPLFIIWSPPQNKYLVCKSLVQEYLRSFSTSGRSPCSVLHDGILCPNDTENDEKAGVSTQILAKGRRGERCQ